MRYFANPASTPPTTTCPPNARCGAAVRIETICQRYGVPIAAAAVQFPLAHPAVATVLTGVRSPAEIEANARLFQHPIPDSLWAELKAEGFLASAAPTPAAPP